MDFQDRYEAWPAMRGKGLTRQRRAIADAVAKRPAPFTADELLAEVAPQKISRPTVFRTLIELVDAGLVERRGGGGATLFGRAG